MSGLISNSTYRTGIKHSFVMAFSSFFRIILGFLPHLVIAKKLGLGDYTDAYLMALSINQILVKFLRIGTLPKIFIMVLSDDFVRDRRKSGSDINNFVSILLVFSCLITGLIFLIAPFLVSIIAKGFSADKAGITTLIIRMLVPMFVYQCLVSLFEAVFKLRSEFSHWALLGILSPLVITISVFFFIGQAGIYSIVYGTLISFVIHATAIIYFIYYKFGYSYNFVFRPKDGQVTKTLKLMFPYYLSSFPVQLLLGVQSFLVSLLPSGFASVFFYANRIIDYVEQFSINVFSQLMLPFFSKKFAESGDYLKKAYSQLIRLTNYIHIPFLIILSILASSIVEVLFGSKLTSNELIKTLGLTFSVFMVFFIPEPSSDIQFNIILSMKKTLWVNIVNIIRMTVVITLSLILFRVFGFWGLIFSYSVTHLQGLLLNQWYLQRYYSFENIFRDVRLWKIILINSIMAFCCYYFNSYLITRDGYLLTSGISKLLVSGAVALIAIILYLFLSWLFKIEEFKMALSFMNRQRDV